MVSNPDITLIDKTPTAITNVVTVNPSNCGVNDGTITVAASGASVQYSIDGGTNYQASNVFSSLGAGTYNVFVKNGDGSCEIPYGSNPVILTIPAAPSITNVTFTDPTNCSFTDGTITVTATGGSGSYEYSSDSGTTYIANGGSFSALAGGTYCIFVRNADGTCIVSGQCVTLTDKVAPVIASTSSTDPTDCGVADGTITILANSSVGNALQYSIDGGANYQSSNVFSALSGGLYPIRVRNADGTCIVSASETLTDKVQPIIDNLTTTNPSNCGVNDGQIVITATGVSLEYSIDNGANWQVSGTFTSLGAGTYNVFVRNTDGSCTTAYGSNPVILTIPSAPSITNVVSSDPTDCSITDGSISITATGGSGSYQYSIDSGTTYQNGNQFTNLSGGTYYVFVRNADTTCIVSGQSVTLTDKVAPVIASVASTNPTDCGVADGTITITANSSVGNSLEFSIDGGSNWQVSNIFSALSGDTYEIRVRNADGTCIVSNPDIVLIDKTPTAISAVATVNPSNCDVSDGTITITATGASVQYSIDGGLNYQASNVFSNLSAGTYNVYVKNGDGSCEIPYGSNSVILTIPSAPSVTNVAFTDPTNCGVVDGTITVTATGGSGSYQYSIDSGTTYLANGGAFTNLAGGTYCIFVKNADGTCIVTGQCVTLTDKVAPVIASVASTNPTDCGVSDGTITISASSSVGNAIEFSIDGGTNWQVSNIFSGLNGDTYEIRVRNADGTCIVSNADVVLIDKVQPNITNVTVVDPSNCGQNDGSITIAATGGGALEYSIDGGLNYQNSGTFTGLSAGTYNGIVRNLDGTCVTAYGSNPINLTTPNAATITNVSFTDPTNCGLTDGTITVAATGGSGSYQFSIDSGSTWTNLTGSFTGLEGDKTYQVRIRNADGTCEVVGQTVILTNKVAPSIVNVSSSNPTDCGVTDGTITIQANSSVGNPIEFSIDGGATYQASNVFTGLDASGNPYEIRVRNADGTCVVPSGNINLTNKTQPVFTTVGSTNPSNCGVDDGTITITATGASLEYSIDGSTNWQASNSFTGLAAGTYNVFIRNGDQSCVTAYGSNPVILTAPNAPSITNVVFSDPTDCNVVDGTITVSAIGGVGALEYSSIDSGSNLSSIEYIHMV